MPAQHDVDTTGRRQDMSCLVSNTTERDVPPAPLRWSPWASGPHTSVIRHVGESLKTLLRVGKTSLLI